MTETQPARFLSLLLGAAAVFVIIWGIQNSAFIINPILLAVVITITVLPLPGKLPKRGLPGWLSFLLTIGVVVGTLLLVILLVVLIRATPDETPGEKQAAMDRAKGLLTRFRSVAKPIAPVEDVAQETGSKS